VKIHGTFASSTHRHAPAQQKKGPRHKKRTRAT
jgi:hypothetical protein